MSGSTQTLKVSQELIETYAQRRNSHLASATGDREYSDEPDPYAFEEGDEEFSFKDKKDKPGAEREGNKKHMVGFSLGLTYQIEVLVWPTFLNQLLSSSKVPTGT